MGPILIFDKSTLESLSVDESVWLDQFFLANITPLFFVETLGDLEKAIADGRAPEDVVGRMAEKTPYGGQPNVYHLTLCRAELINGFRITMDGRPIVHGGDEKRVDGRRAVFVEEAPEAAALQRWRRRQFLETERQLARGWRSQLDAIDLDSAFRLGRDILNREGRPRDLFEARALADKLLAKRGSRYTLDALGRVPPAPYRDGLIERWRAAGGAAIRTLAPYTAHIFSVDLFFTIGLGADLISRERPSNKVDLAYLYYLPFCQVFTSNDRLHERMVRPFLRDSQAFVRGQDLKADLGRLDAHYSELPAEVKARGVLSFAGRPPTGSLVSEVWAMLGDHADGGKEDVPSPIVGRAAPRDPAADRALIEHVGRIVDAAPVRDSLRSIDEADELVVRHWVPRRKGKWLLVPAE